MKSKGAANIKLVHGGGKRGWNWPEKKRLFGRRSNIGARGCRDIGEGSSCESRDKKKAKGEREPKKKAGGVGEGGNSKRGSDAPLPGAVVGKNTTETSLGRDVLFAMQRGEDVQKGAETVESPSRWDGSIRV